MLSTIAAPRRVIRLASHGGTFPPWSGMSATPDRFTLLWTRLPDLLVLFDFPVADVDDAVGVQGDVVLVGHQDNGIALLIEALEEGHDFVAGGSIEVTGGLV